MVGAVRLGCCRNRNHRGQELSIRAISRLFPGYGINRVIWQRQIPG
jgi:hypothetical protein